MRAFTTEKTRLRRISEVQDFGQQQDTHSSTQVAVDSHREEPVETAKEC